MSAEDLQSLDLSNLALLNRPEVELLTVTEERSLLLELCDCKTLLLQSRLTGTGEPGCRASRRGGEFRMSFVIFSSRRRRILRKPGISWRLPRVTTRFAPGWRWPTCGWWPTCLAGIAIAGWRLATCCRKVSAACSRPSIASIARRKPDWPLTPSGGYDRRCRRAVAAGAYPVRLNPRHLQQLAEHVIQTWTARRSLVGSLARPGP